MSCSGFLSFAPVQMHGPFCCAFGGYPSRKCLQGTFAFRGIPAPHGSEPRVQSPKVLQCVCCECFGCRVLPCCRVQMLPFTAASEQGEMFAKTAQYKVSQCVVVNSLSFFPVQMHGPFCCAFGGYPCQKHIQGTFAICCLPTPPGI